MVLTTTLNRFRGARPQLGLAVATVALLLGPSAAASAPKSVQFCSTNHVCVEASLLKIDGPVGGGTDGPDAMDVMVQLNLPNAIPQVDLRRAAVFASHPVIVHLGNWSHVLPQHLHLDNTIGSACTDSPCTAPTDWAQYALHFRLPLPKNLPLGFHQLWLTIPGEHGQVLSTPRYGYPTPVPQPKSTYRLSGDVVTIKISSIAFTLATPEADPIWASAQLSAKGAMKGAIAAATASNSVTLSHPAKTVTFTVKLRPAGHWYIQWSMRPSDPRDLRFGQFDGPLRQYQRPRLAEAPSVIEANSFASIPASEFLSVEVGRAGCCRPAGVP